MGEGEKQAAKGSNEIVEFRRPEKTSKKNNGGKEEEKTVVPVQKETRQGRETYQWWGGGRLKASGDLRKGKKD